VIDNESEAGSWRRDWDSRSHTPQELNQRINELKDDLKIVYEERDMCRIAMLNVMALVRGKVPNSRYMPDQIYDILAAAIQND